LLADWLRQFATVRKPPSSEKIGKTGTGTARRGFSTKLALYFQEFQLGHCPEKGRKGRLGHNAAIFLFDLFNQNSIKQSYSVIIL
jgi:hypothetical protein